MGLGMKPSPEQEEPMGSPSRLRAPLSMLSTYPVAICGGSPMIPPIDWTAGSTAGITQRGFSQLTVSSVAALEFHAKSHEDGDSSQQTERRCVFKHGLLSNLPDLSQNSDASEARVWTSCSPLLIRQNKTLPTVSLVRQRAAGSPVRLRSPQPSKSAAANAMASQGTSPESVDGRMRSSYQGML